MNIINPFFSTAKQLGMSDAALLALKIKVENELKRLDTDSRVSVVALQSIDPALADLRTWNEVKKLANLQQEEP